jgi:exopolyphosphatase/guanosine-5'-triphosphate,3'-diphosphate pyrophosphatase
VRTAIIDLGTNTFNLLIADVDALASTFTVVHAAKQAVKIGDGGITKGYITDEAVARAMSALAVYRDTMAQFDCHQVLAFGTSAMRDAANGGLLAQRIEQELGIHVSIISGQLEAQLITEGVRLAVPMDNRPVLIMDIGGGSTEFIIANGTEVFWKESYQLGVSRILQLLPLSDPMTTDDVLRLDQLLTDQLHGLHQTCTTHGVTTMIGSSGSFDSFFEMLWAQKGQAREANSILTATFDMQELEALDVKLMAMNHAQRRAVPGLVEMRVDTIHIASHMVQWVLHKCVLNAVVLSTYALKEGVIHRVMEGKDVSG